MDDKHSKLLKICFNVISPRDLSTKILHAYRFLLASHNSPGSGHPIESDEDRLTGRHTILIRRGLFAEIMYAFHFILASHCCS
jgi:hypothetical protein